MQFNSAVLSALDDLSKRVDNIGDAVMNKLDKLISGMSDPTGLEKRVESMEVLLFRTSLEDFERIDKIIVDTRKMEKKDSQEQPEHEQSPEKECMHFDISSDSGGKEQREPEEAPTTPKNKQKKKNKNRSKRQHAAEKEEDEMNEEEKYGGDHQQLNKQSGDHQKSSSGSSGKEHTTKDSSTTFAKKVVYEEDPEMKSMMRIMLADMRNLTEEMGETLQHGSSTAATGANT
mmetsp:Transcript_80915/g.262049  ORF Transcript_80915/g.262049 Transcript_80915/m.262049 type:complete len:231 (-) Transcript_80915:113-805(-)